MAKEKSMNEKDDCYVEAFEKKIDPAALKNATYTSLAIAGMGCPRCAMRVRNGLLSIEGVLSADVNHETGRAVVAYKPQSVSIEKLFLAVEQSGNDGRHNYTAILLENKLALEN